MEAQDNARSASMQRQGSTSSEKLPSSNTSSKGNKLNQVVQNFYVKAAHIITQARQPVTPLYNRTSSGKRLNRWFNIDTVETDAFRDELRSWKLMDVSSTDFRSTMPLTIDVVLMTRDLTANQTLVLVNNDGSRIDIETGGSRRKLDSGSVLLERWQVSWESPGSDDAPELPVIYKKSIVVFRALFTLTRLLPAWRLRKRLARSKLTGNTLKVVCQVEAAAPGNSSSSRTPIFRQSADLMHNRVDTYNFHKVETAAGKLCISVQYLADCDFRVDDSEALLSSQFLTSDQGSSRHQSSSSESARRSSRPASYTPAGASTSGSGNSVPYMTINDHRGASMPRQERRPSAALIQPFKTPSLSASPSLDPMLGSPRTLPRSPSSASIERLNARTNSYTQFQRISVGMSETGQSSMASPRAQPPQLLKRYSSSFGQRSGSFLNRRRTSQASESASPTDFLPAGSASRSPSIFMPDANEQDLGDFVNMLDDRKPLVGAQFKNDKTVPAKVLSQNTSIRTNDELEKFHRLKSSHVTLSNSLHQSTQLQADLYREVAVPSIKPNPSVSGVSATSYSPGKSSSPHTPAIPSKLSKISVPHRTTEIRSPHDTEGLDHVKQHSVNESQFAHQTALPGDEPITHLGPENADGSRGQFFSNAIPHFGEGPVGTDQLSMPLVRTRDTQMAQVDPSVDGPSSPDNAVHRSSCSSSDQRTQDCVWGASQRDTEDGNKSADTESGQLRAELPMGATSPAATIDDDDLFFAMSDIHLGSTKHPR